MAGKEWFQEHIYVSDFALEIWVNQEGKGWSQIIGREKGVLIILYLNFLKKYSSKFRLFIFRVIGSVEWFDSALSSSDD